MHICCCCYLSSIMMIGNVFPELIRVPMWGYVPVFVCGLLSQCNLLWFVGTHTHTRGRVYKYETLCTRTAQTDLANECVRVWKQKRNQIEVVVKRKSKQRRAKVRRRECAHIGNVQIYYRVKILLNLHTHRTILTRTRTHAHIRTTTLCQSKCWLEVKSIELSYIKCTPPAFVWMCKCV